MNKTSTAIQEVLQSIRSLDKVEAHLKDLKGKIKKMQADQNLLKSQMIDKDELVKDLEGLSLKGIFHKVLGNKEQQIEKGRQEFLEVYLKLEELNKSLELLKFEESVLEEKRAKNSGLREKLDKLMRQREKELKATNTKEGLRLRKMAKEVDHHNLMIWEIGEANKAGAKAVRSLDEIIHFLKGARNWGHVYGRNDRWSTYRRQTNIDKARQKAHFARQQLYVFQRELGDLYSQIPDYAASLQLDLYEGFLATIFRNMISDWVLQQKIKNTLGNVSSVRDSVILEIHKLSAEKNQQTQALEKLELEKSMILMNS